MKTKKYFILLVLSSVIFISLDFYRIYNEYTPSEGKDFLQNVLNFNDSPINSLTDLQSNQITEIEGNSEEIGSIFGLKFKDTIVRSVEDFWKKAQKSQYSKDGRGEILKEQEQIIQKCSPGMILEWKAIAKASGVPYYDILAINLLAPLLETNKMEDDGCTSWIATGSATKDGKTLHHKNCDSSRLPHSVVRIKERGKNGFIAIVDEATLDVRAGINDVGLSVTNNFVFVAQVNLMGIPTNTLNRLLLEDCDSVDEAYEYISTHPRQEGAIFVIGDKEKGAVVESSPAGISSYRDSIVEDDVGYRANHFIHLEGDYPLETSVIRYEAAKDFLEDEKGSLTIRDFNELSRHLHYADDTVGKRKASDGSICNYHTVFGATFQIDNDYPEQLSVMWIALGAPCSSLYSPIHIGSDDIFESLQNDDMWKTCDKVYEKNLGPLWGLMPYFFEKEDQMIEEAILVENETFLQLEAGNDKEATKILTDFDLDKAESNYDKLEELSEDTYWIDSFYSDRAIDSKENIEITNNSVTLAESKMEGDFTSIPIITAKNGWEQANFYAEQSLPLGTSINYTILDASDDKVLFHISSEEAKSGYDLSNLDVESIEISVELATNDTNFLPILYELKIIELTPIQEESTQDYTMLIALIFIVAFLGILAIVVVSRRKKIKNKRETLRETTATKNEPQQNDKVIPLKDKESNEMDQKDQLQYASTTSRIAAWLLDMVFIGVIFAIVYSCSIYIIGIIPISFSMNIFLTITILITAFFLTGFLYFWILESRRNGMTLGKYLMNLRSVNQVTFKSASTRECAINSLTKSNLLIILDLILGAIRNRGKFETKKFRYTQNIAKIVVVKVKREKEVKLNDYILPVLGAIISLVAMFAPAASIFDVITFHIWMWGLVSGSSFIKGYAKISFFQNVFTLIFSIVCSVMILISCLLIIFTSFQLKKSKIKIENARKMWYIFGFAQVLTVIVWMIIIQLTFQIDTNGAFSNYAPWSIMVPSWALMGVIIGAFLTNIGAFIRKRK